MKWLSSFYMGSSAGSRTVTSTINTSIGFFLILSNLLIAEVMMDFNGMLSTTTQINEEKSPGIYLRYLPKLDILTETGFDFEFSLNAIGYSENLTFSEFADQFKIKPYRIWGRYQTAYFEARLGLQKINFGPARILRSLMWFDRLDPRDPLQFTEGVQALRLQYYFPNNANMWFWGLYGNKDPKGWEFFGSDKTVPEFGGRMQYPVLNGEFALSVHRRTIDEKIKENRIAVDGFWDAGIGLWFESALVKMDTEDNYQSFLTVGSDYTLPRGNGISVTGEHLFISIANQPFERDSSQNVSSLSIQYPLGMLDNLAYFNYYSWNTDTALHYLSWRRTYDRWTIQCAGYFSEKTLTNIYGNDRSSAQGRRGLQFTIIFNH